MSKKNEHETLQMAPICQQQSRESKHTESVDMLCSASMADCSMALSIIMNFGTRLYFGPGPWTLTSGSAGRDRSWNTSSAQPARPVGKHDSVIQRRIELEHYLQWAKFTHKFSYRYYPKCVFL